MFGNNRFSFGNEKMFEYTQSNIIDLISEAGGTARYNLLSIIDYIADPENKKPFRATPITSMTHYEKIILSQDFKIDNLDNCLNNAYIANKIRIFYVPNTDCSYYIKFINDIAYIFLGNCEEDILVNFIYDFTMASIEYSLKKFNIISYNNSIEDFFNEIESNANMGCSDVTDVEFIVEYYADIFNVVYNMTNHEIVNWEFLSEKFKSRWMLMDLSCYEKIWEYAISISKYVQDNPDAIFPYQLEAIESVYSYLNTL